MNKTFTKSFIALVAMFCCVLSANAEGTTYTGVTPENGKEYYLYCPASGEFVYATDPYADDPDWAGIMVSLGCETKPAHAWTVSTSTDGTSLSTKIGETVYYLTFVAGRMEGEYSVTLKNNAQYISITKSGDYYTIGNGSAYLWLNNSNVAASGSASNFIFVSTSSEEEPVTPTTVDLTLDENATMDAAIASIVALGDAVANVTVKRTMSTDKWNTLCLPFSLTADEVNTNFGTGATIMKMKNITSEGEVVFETATTIEAGKNYIVKPAKGITQIVAQGKEGIKNKTSINGYIDNVWFETMDVKAPIFNETELGWSTYPTYILSGDKFYSVDSNITFKGFRWYLQDISQTLAKQLTLNLNGEITSISEIEEGTDPMVNGACFNLQGQRVNANAKGIIIKNGKKYINK